MKIKEKKLNLVKDILFIRRKIKDKKWRKKDAEDREKKTTYNYKTVTFLALTEVYSPFPSVIFFVFFIFFKNVF